MRRSLGARCAIAAFAVLLGLVLLAGVGVASYVAWVNNNIERIADPFADLDPEARPAPAPVDPEKDTPALNILILGSDSRISAGDPAQWASGAQRTDAVLIAHLAADRETAVIMSIPRDSWVSIPGHSEAKINAAFSYGGPSLTIETIESLTGIRIDHFLLADFSSFVELTDALGGVEIDVPTDAYQQGELLFSAGNQTLNGEQALVYTRQRYGLPGGDLDRVKRQQNWIRAIIAKARTDGTLTSPVRLTGLLNTVGNSVAVDDSLSLSKMRELAEGLRDLRPSDISFITAPTTGPGRSEDGQSVLILDRSSFDPLVASIADDTAASYVADHGDLLSVLDDAVQ